MNVAAWILVGYMLRAFFARAGKWCAYADQRWTAHMEAERERRKREFLRSHEEQVVHEQYGPQVERLLRTIPKGTR